MKVILQCDIFERSKEIFNEASKKHGIEFFVTDALEEEAMLDYHKMGATCFIIGAEAYSTGFYSKISEGSAIIRYGVGYNNVPIDICLRRNIKVAYTPGTLTDSVAEHTFALILGVIRKIPDLHQSMMANEWKGLTGIELKNKTIAIIGFGLIGQAVAKIAKNGFGMKVNVFDILKITNNDIVDFYSDIFEEVVRDADIVSIHMAASSDNNGFINNEKIDMMKDGAIFINTARGELVIEEDLYVALENGKIAASGLDVFKDEPYRPGLNMDLRELKNVVFTPHCGSNTIESNNRMAKMTIKNILAHYSSHAMTLIPEIK